MPPASRAGGRLRPTAPIGLLRLGPTPVSVCLLGDLLEIAVHWLPDRTRTVPCVGACDHCAAENPPQAAGYAAAARWIPDGEGEGRWRRVLLYAPPYVLDDFAGPQRGRAYRLWRESDTHKTVLVEYLRTIRAPLPAFDVRAQLAMIWHLRPDLLPVLTPPPLASPTPDTPPPLPAPDTPVAFTAAGRSIVSSVFTPASPMTATEDPQATAEALTRFREHVRTFDRPASRPMPGREVRTTKGGA